MPNMSIKKTPMQVLNPKERIKSFDEVSLGYTKEEAVNEAKRCLNCKNKPCTSLCPVAIDIPGFIRKVADEDFEGAYEILTKQSSLPAVCGRVCPQETQCEMKCVRGLKCESVAIGRLERFVADWHMQNSKEENSTTQSNRKKVAVIGSGPAGLTCAGDLARFGYDVTVFEALHTAGGVLVYGIPEFRLPKEIVKKEIEKLISMGVKIKTNMIIGKVFSIDELLNDEFDAVFIGTGAGLPKFMNIDGENLNGVYSANEFLTRINLMKAYEENSHTPILRAKKVAVVGGGNVAMDSARCALRLGAEKVYIVYRRGIEEIPARNEEIEHAMEEGVEFLTLTIPKKILGDENNFVTSMECIKMELGEPDESGRRSPFEKKGSEFILEIDSVIMSIGTSPNPLIKNTTPDLETNRHGCIITKGNNGETSIEGVYAGGDVVTGAATVILAMGAGKKAASAIDQYLKSKETF